MGGSSVGVAPLCLAEKRASSKDDTERATPAPDMIASSEPSIRQDGSFKYRNPCKFGDRRAAALLCLRPCLPNVQPLNGGPWNPVLTIPS